MPPENDADDEALQDRLRDCAANLADRAISLLRLAMNTEDDAERVRLVAQEKRVTRARRAVEKAIGLLAGRD